jgi:DNA modification methylase
VGPVTFAWALGLPRPYPPFAGSGATLVAAQTLARSCYGMEIDPRYVQITIERWQGLAGREAERIDR